MAAANTVEVFTFSASATKYSRSMRCTEELPALFISVHVPAVGDDRDGGQQKLQFFPANFVERLFHQADSFFGGPVNSVCAMVVVNRQLQGFVSLEKVLLSITLSIHLLH